MTYFYACIFDTENSDANCEGSPLIEPTNSDDEDSQSTTSFHKPMAAVMENGIRTHLLGGFNDNVDDDTNEPCVGFDNETLCGELEPVNPSYFGRGDSYCLEKRQRSGTGSGHLLRKDSDPPD